MRAHANDLREEVAKDFGIQDGDKADGFVHAIASNWRDAPLTGRDQALCGYAEKLTLSPRAMSENDIRLLRDAGFSDAAIHDATQVIGYFNYINRVADALDVDQEDFIRAWEKSPHA